MIDRWRESAHRLPAGKAFARRFLVENKSMVAYSAVSQMAVVMNAARERWVWCALWVAVLTSNVWVLVRRAAGLPEPVAARKPREEMTPREAFWLDPSAVFDRERRRSRASS